MKRFERHLLGQRANRVKKPAMMMMMMMKRLDVLEGHKMCKSCLYSSN
jgi:hypothetical protein